MMPLARVREEAGPCHHHQHGKELSGDEPVLHADVERYQRHQTLRVHHYAEGE
jgi:hypothetical protein